MSEFSNPSQNGILLMESECLYSHLENPRLIQQLGHTKDIISKRVRERECDFVYPTEVLKENQFHNFHLVTALG